jgi:hypothetical protein
MLFSISEILKKAESQKTPADKVKTLQTFDNPVLRLILKCAYDPSVKFLLPTGEIPYKRSKITESQTVLYAQSKKLYIFIDGQSPANLGQKKREILWSRLLESLDSEDAELMCAVKDKKLPYKSLTKVIIKRAFPELFNE